ncbi:hypothetical protein LJC48_00700 [Desulfovibrio sp. OttesenSCG-928-C06]|nr:hypothetical protein [Desulfovibrio sp. OttesenSCG-928-C06]
MEILDALEQKVTYLLKEVVILRNEKDRLEQLLAANYGGSQSKYTTEPEAGSLARIKELEEALAAEKELSGTVLKRVDALIQRLEGEKTAG